VYSLAERHGKKKKVYEPPPRVRDRWIRVLSLSLQGISEQNLLVKREKGVTEAEKEWRGGVFGRGENRAWRRLLERPTEKDKRKMIR